MTTPLIFDRTELRRRRERAAGGLPDHDFLFRHAAGDVAERLSVLGRSFPRVLDLGGRGGAFLECWRPEEPPDFAVLSDLSFAMVRNVRGRGAAPVVADEERLPFAEGTFDLIVSILSLHAVNDLPGSLIQIRRALRPGGAFAGVFFGPETLAELRHALLAAEAECEGGASPRVAPFVDVRDLGDLLARAGLTRPVADSERLSVRYPSVPGLVRELRGMGETNVLHDRSRRPMRRETFIRMCAEYEARHGQADGRIPARFELVHAFGRAPGDGERNTPRPRGSTPGPAGA